MSDLNQKYDWVDDRDVLHAVATWAIDNGEITTPREVLDFFEKPWHWPEWHDAWAATVVV